MKTRIVYLPGKSIDAALKDNYDLVHDLWDYEGSHVVECELKPVRIVKVNTKIELTEVKDKNEKNKK